MSTKGRLAVIGQGYVGLPLAMRAAQVGYQVIGIDLDMRRVESLQKGSSFVEDIEDTALQEALDQGRYTASGSYEDVKNFDVAVITVPTPLRDSHPDLSFIESSAIALGAQMKSGSTVILESTTYPGTTEEILIPLLEKSSGLSAGTDFYVGYSPERIDPGNKAWSFVNTPKLISGTCASSMERVSSFYGDLVDTTIPVSGVKEAELAKLLENTFRHVNIALVNELAIFANQLDVNVWESIDAAGTKPFGFMKFTPGPGVGGHCLPVDPSYLSWRVKNKLGKNFRFVELANDVNDHMPDYVMQRLMHMLNEDRRSLNGSNILIVGVAYKSNTGDVRESPALRVMELLHGAGANVHAVDPHVEPYNWPADVLRVDLSADVLTGIDCAVVLTVHAEFDLELFEDFAGPVLDTRRCVTSPRVEYL